MKDRDVRALVPGLYVLKIDKQHGGGTVLAAVGPLHGTDGLKWYANSDRSESRRTAGNVIETKWDHIESATVLRTHTLQGAIDTAKWVANTEAMDPDLLKVVRDAFLSGNDAEAVAIIANQLGLVCAETPFQQATAMAFANAADLQRRINEREKP